MKLRTTKKPKLNEDFEEEYGISSRKERGNSQKNQTEKENQISIEVI